MTKESKYQRLIEIIEEMGSVVVAFSGGVDSTFLLQVAHHTLGDKAVAVTITSPFHATWEIEEAKDFATQLEVQHVIITKELENEALIMNPENRCYLCKKDVFSGILAYARKNGYAYVADGSNYDDTFDYRPGMQALKELNIRSPLLEAGLTKEEIRGLSKDLELSTWNKPPYACLLTRIPYGQEIKVENLRKIEEAEVYLMALGFKQVRVRFHGEIARIELEKEELSKIFSIELMEQINHRLKQIGFQYVTLDLQGYKTGRFNEGIKR